MKMAPFEILDTCERVLIPYLRTPMGRAIAARLVCVEMESFAAAFDLGSGRVWLSRHGAGAVRHRRRGFWMLEQNERDLGRLRARVRKGDGEA